MCILKCDRIYLVEAEVEHVLDAFLLHLVQQRAGDGHGAVNLVFAVVVELDAVVPECDDVVAAAWVLDGVRQGSGAKHAPCRFVGVTYHS